MVCIFLAEDGTDENQIVSVMVLVLSGMCLVAHDQIVVVGLLLIDKGTYALMEGTTGITRSAYRTGTKLKKTCERKLHRIDVLMPCIVDTHYDQVRLSVCSYRRDRDPDRDRRRRDWDRAPDRDGPDSAYYSRDRRDKGR